MSRSLYITAPEGHSGKSAVALGLVDLLSRRVGRVGVFRPIINRDHDNDTVVDLLIAHPGVRQGYDDAVGVTYAQWHADQDAALSRIVDRFGELSADYDAVVVVGSDYTDVTTGNEWASNARIAANLGSPVVIVVHGSERTPAVIAATIDLARSELTAAHAQPVAAIANRVDPEAIAAVRGLLAKTGLVSGAIADVPLRGAPTVAELRDACGAVRWRGGGEL